MWPFAARPLVKVTSGVKACASGSEGRCGHHAVGASLWRHQLLALCSNTQRVRAVYFISLDGAGKQSYAHEKLCNKVSGSNLSTWYERDCWKVLTTLAIAQSLNPPPNSHPTTASRVYSIYCLVFFHSCTDRKSLRWWYFSVLQFLTIILHNI